MALDLALGGLADDAERERRCVMAQFVARPEKVEAVQWLKEGDHPEVSGDVFSGGGLINAQHRWGRVKPGDWIVTHADGTLEVLAPEKFAREYQPADAKPEPGPAKPELPATTAIIKAILPTLRAVSLGGVAKIQGSFPRHVLRDSLRELNISQTESAST